MKAARLGDKEVGRLGLGLMGMSGVYTGAGENEEGSIATIERALDLGVTHLDTAEFYGPFTNEELLARVLKRRRDDAVIATKFGMLLHRTTGERGLDGSPENMRIALEGSLRRLGVETIDLYYLHRMDPATPIEETVGAFAEFIAEGKIGGYGLSEASAETIRRAHAVHPVTAVQTEYSLWAREVEESVLPTTRELGITFVPYSPLGRGMLTGAIRSTKDLDKDDFRLKSPWFQEGNFEANLGIVDEVTSIATDLGIKPGQVAIAWLLAQGDDIAPIPGTKRIPYLEENVAAESIELSPEHLARLDGISSATGARYTDMSAIQR